MLTLIKNFQRLFQYTSKFVSSVLQIYYTKYPKGGQDVLELLFKCKELERYFSSCRSLLVLGCCADQFYLALKSMHIYDPVIRTTMTTSNLWLCFKMFSDHLLWFNSIGLLKIDSQRWTESLNRFWFYSASANLLRDFYELICIIHEARNEDNLDCELSKLSLGTPMRWISRYPKLSCDLIKNLSDFWIPYASVNDLKMHPLLISIFGIVSTTMGILQVYDEKYRLSSS